MVRSGTLVCRKIKLKKFPDPETAGGCGVAPFLSAKDLFCRRIAAPAQRHAHDLLCVLRWVNLLPEVLRARSAASEEGNEKAHIMRACCHRQAIIFWYLLRICPAFVAVCTNASALVGVPTVGCEWFAHCCASSASKSMVSSIMVRALMLSLPI